MSELTKSLRLFICLLAMILAGQGIATAQAHDAQSHVESSLCTDLPTQPAAPAKSQPDRTVECPYDFDELLVRITRLSINTSLPDSVETIERAFGLPQMTTAFDDPSSASYRMTVTGKAVPGKDGWRLILEAQESYKGPDGATKAFVPGPRPKRLQNITDALFEVRLDIRGAATWGADECVPVAPLSDALLAGGWGTELQPPPMDGALDTLLFGYDHKHVSIQGRRESCTHSITLTQDPHP